MIPLLNVAFIVPVGTNVKQSLRDNEYEINLDPKINALRAVSRTNPNIKLIVPMSNISFATLK